MTYPPSWQPGPPPTWQQSAPPSAGFADRIPVGLQILINAGLLVPALAIRWLQQFVGRSLGPTRWSDLQSFGFVAGWTALLYMYLAVVVAVFGRTNGRRVGAALTVVGGLLIYLVGQGAYYLVGSDDWVMWFRRVVTVVAFTAFAAAWGIARRRHGLWTVGLIAAVLFGFATQFLLPTQMRFAGWSLSSGIWIGGFVLSCLICWGFDAIGRLGKSTPGPNHHPPQQHWPQDPHR